MANETHLAWLKQGVPLWNQWRKEHPHIHPDLSRADLHGMELKEAYFRDTALFHANLSGANLVGANLSRADLYNTDLRGANLQKVAIRRAKLEKAKLNHADLWKADCRKADFREANLSDATLVGANLEQAQLVGANRKRADLTNCRIYGISAWEVKLAGATQTNLIVTRSDQPTITVDNLEIAQFIYLLLNNESIRHVIEAITAKVVLLLGQFTPKRKAILGSQRAKPNAAWTRSAIRFVARFVKQQIDHAIKLPTAAAMNKINVTSTIVRRIAGAPINTAIPVFTRVFEITAMTTVYVAVCILSGVVAVRFAIERAIASTSVAPATAPAR